MWFTFTPDFLALTPQAFVDQYLVGLKADTVVAGLTILMASGMLHLWLYCQNMLVAGLMSSACRNSLRMVKGQFSGNGMPRFQEY